MRSRYLSSFLRYFTFSKKTCWYHYKVCACISWKLFKILSYVGNTYNTVTCRVQFYTRFLQKVLKLSNLNEEKLRFLKWVILYLQAVSIPTFSFVSKCISIPCTYCKLFSLQLIFAGWVWRKLRLSSKYY